MTKEQFLLELEHIAESGSNDIRLGNLYDQVLQSLQSENEELRKRCSMNYGGGFTEEEITISALREKNEKQADRIRELEDVLREVIKQTTREW